MLGFIFFRCRFFGTILTVDEMRCNMQQLLPYRSCLETLQGACS